MTKYIEQPRPLAQHIIETCAYILGCRPKDITGPSRREPYVNHRKIVAMELRAAGFSLTETGRILNRHHSTIVSSCKLYSDYCDVWPDFRVKANACAAAVAAIYPHIKISIEL